MLTKEEIEQLVKDLLTLNQQEATTALEKRLAALEKPQDIDQEPSDKATEALEARLKTLEAQLKQEQERLVAQEQTAASLRFDSSLSSVLDEMKPLHKGIVQELLATRIKQDAVEKDGSWLTKDGKTIKEAIASFFDTDAGKHFLPSSHQDGAGTTVAQPSRSTTAVDTIEALRQAFI